MWWTNIDDMVYIEGDCGEWLRIERYRYWPGVVLL